MPPKAKEPEAPEEERPRSKRAPEHKFSEYACDCGCSWPKSLGRECPECHPKPQPV